MKRFYFFSVILGCFWLHSNALWAQQQADTSTISGQTNVMSELNVANVYPSNWASIAATFKRFRNFLGSSSQPVTNYTWTVPQGVTKVMIECWGGGQGTSNTETAAGAGGHYYMAIVPVTAGTNLEIAVGWGGLGSGGIDLRNGQPTTVSWLGSGNFYLTAGGGGGGSTRSLPGGSYSFFVLGNSGAASDFYFNRKSQFTNTVQVIGGSGGGVYGFPMSGGAGSNFSYIEIVNTLDVYSIDANGGFPGGGAGSGMSFFSNQLNHSSNGGAGMALIRW